MNINEAFDRWFGEDQPWISPREVSNKRKGWKAACEWILKDIMQLVNEQAEDEGLWFIAENAPEDYLQQALRRLHKHIEDIDKQQKDK